METHIESWEIEFEEKFYMKLGDEYWLDNGYYSSPDRELGDKIKAFIRTQRNKSAVEALQKAKQYCAYEYKNKCFVIREDLLDQLLCEYELQK